MYQLLLIIGILFIASICLVFNYEFKNAFYKENLILKIICIITFLLHILFTLNTGYYEKGHLIM